MNRRAVLAGSLALAFAAPAMAQQARVTRVTGTVTAKNYRALAALLLENLDQVVSLSVSFPAGDSGADGALFAAMEGDLFIAYVAGPGNDTQISAAGGFIDAGDRFVFDRFYKVTHAGTGQGISAIFIESTMPPNVPVDTIHIDDLRTPG